MSVKRLPSVSHFNGHSNHNSPTATTTTTTTTTRTTAISATTMSFAAISAYNQNSGDSYSQIGGLGLLHQQNLRSGVNAVIGGGIGGGAPVMGGSSGSSGGHNNINGNVNVLLGCAMLSVVTTVLCVVCYCCHRNIKKRTEAAYRQRWMDNDANMEIYSVEQCYETSGLFMESSEGLAVPALTHEPPPSYDAVVAIQEDSQALRISPPPDYRSMNDVSGSSNPGEIPKFIRENYFLGMQHKRLSAHSCCSLQRAEAENRYHMGVDAAVTDATSGRFCMSALGRKSLMYTAREGRPLNQPYYRGCPLCGKFRHDDSMSLSSDSGLDQVVLAVDVGNGSTVDKNACYCTPLQSPITDDSNNNVDDHESHFALTTDDRRSVRSLQAVDEASCENAINNNNNVEGGNNSPTTSAASASTPSSSATAANASASDNHRVANDVTLDLDSINDNGIIRLDMSKIIDKTGLPTYEAALKLESSGYV